MKIAGVRSPRAEGASAIRSTRPVAGACIGTDTKPSAWAIGSPRTTSWPSRTIAFAGAPVCCERGTTSIGGNGRRRMGRRQVCSLCSGTCTPRQSLLPPMSSRTPMLVVLCGALKQLGRVLFIRIGRRSGMNHLSRAFFRRPDQILVRAALGVLHVSVLIRVVGENLRVDVDALVAGRAQIGFDP